MEQDTTQAGGGAEPEREPAADTRRGAPETPAVASYRVELDTYSGPLDLLLYLIRKEEVDIYDIPIAHIAEQYQRYLDMMAEINVNVAGEFLVVAATLMEIKSRMLIPREEGLEGDEEEDPRLELVRQLLEYKRYKDLARELGARADEQALKFSRPVLDGDAAAGEAPEEPGPDGAADDPLQGIGLWELVDAFARVLSATRIGPPAQRVIERQRPIHEYCVELLRILSTHGQVVFSAVFRDCQTRDEMVAMFIALLELVRLRRVRLQQAQEFGEIYVSLVDAAAATEPLPTEAEAAPPQPPSTLPRPESGSLVSVRAIDVLSEIEEEEESLGRAREIIDGAIARSEEFLKRHHEQTQAAAAGEQDAPGTAAPEPLPAGEAGKGVAATPAEPTPPEPPQEPDEKAPPMRDRACL